MSKWLEKQLKYNSELGLPKIGVYSIRTNNTILSDLLNRPDYREILQKDIAKEVERNFDFGEFLIKELMKEYKRTAGRDGEWGLGGHVPGVEGDWEAWIYLYPTDKEINFKLKTKKWIWCYDEWMGKGVQTANRWLHISYFSQRGWNPRVFIRVEKIKQVKQELQI